MIDLEIIDMGSFVRSLLLEDSFDTFLLMEAKVKSSVSYLINGRINKDFFDKDILENLPSSDYISWGTVKDHVYNMIKGKQLPLSFKVVLLLSPKNIETIIEQNNLPLSLSDVSALSLNILFDGKNIQITTGTALNTFTIDKSLEHLWDENIIQYFKSQKIEFEKQ